MRASKQGALEGLEKGGLQEAMGAAYSEVRAMVKSADFSEGPRAFAEKRKPNWTGR